MVIGHWSRQLPGLAIGFLSDFAPSREILTAESQWLQGEEAILTVNYNLTLAQNQLSLLKKTFADFHSIAQTFEIDTDLGIDYSKIGPTWKADKKLFARHMYRQIRNKKCNWLRNLFCSDCKRLKKIK